MRPGPPVLAARFLVGGLLLGASCAGGDDPAGARGSSGSSGTPGIPGPTEKTTSASTPDVARASASRDDGPRPVLGDDWYARRARARHPELVARLESQARAVAQHPDDGSARSEYGGALMQLGRIEEALIHLRRAVELAPQDPLAQRRLGQALLRDGQYEAACARLERGFELAPGGAQAHFFLGAALERLGRVDEALEQFRRAREAEPENPDARYREALLILDDEPDQALRLFEEVLELESFHPGAAINLARLYRRAGRTDEAREMLRRHQEIGLLADLGVLDEPLAARRFQVEAEYYGRQGARDTALEVLARGIERHPQEPELWALRAELLLDSDDASAARTALERASELAQGARVQAGGAKPQAQLATRLAELRTRLEQVEAR